MNALARYYGRASSQGTMANLRRYEQMMPQETAQDALFRQRYGISRQEAVRRYGNRQMLDYYKALRGWRATADRYSAMTLNFPMQESAPESMAGGGYGGYGGGGYGGYGGGSLPSGMNLPEWYLAIMSWRI